MPGPYFSFFEDMHPRAIKDACDYLDLVIAEEGPFTGVIGFSQGAALAISYLLNHEIQRPHAPPPFRWAALFSPTLALSPDPRYMEREVAALNEEYGSSIFAEEGAWKAERGKLRGGRTGLVLDKNKRALIQENIDLIRASVARAGPDMVERFDKMVKERCGRADDVPRVYHPLTTTQRIPLPTLVVAGQRDDVYRLRQARLMRKLCATDQCTFVEHSGGHDVPRQAHELQKVLISLTRLIEQSKWSQYMCL